MKKNKDLIYKCEECGFVTNENNKVCVLCGKKTINVNQKKRLYFNSLPPFLEQKQDTCLVYYCKRCNEVEKTKVCLLNNTINSLALRYQKRLILLETIKHLNEVFTNEEIKDILNKLSDEEKDLIYLNYQASYRYFYKQDKTKASIMFFLSALMSYLAFSLADYYQDKETVIISYFALGFSIATLFILACLGFEYMWRAYKVEYEKLAKKIVIIASSSAVLYILLMIYFDLGFILAVRYALISLVIMTMIYMINSLEKKV